MTRRWLWVLLATMPACDRPTGTQAPPARSAAPGSASAGVPVATAPLPDAARDDARISTRFDTEEIGTPPASFEPVVGEWRIGEAAGARGLEVDGTKWRDGTASVNLADQAKRLYGDRYAEFLDGVKAFAFYPLAIHEKAPPPGDLRLGVRFYPTAGKIDQAAGIAFGIAPNGSYWGVRANALEDNLLFFKVVKGVRTVIDTIRSVPTPTRTWHSLGVELRGSHLSVWLDGVKRFEKKLDVTPVGRVGLWSKADSKVLFDDFEVGAP